MDITELADTLIKTHGRNIAAEKLKEELDKRRIAGETSEALKKLEELKIKQAGILDTLKGRIPAGDFADFLQIIQVKGYL